MTQISTRAHLEQWEKSGMSMSEYSRQAGIRVQRLYSARHDQRKRSISLKPVEKISEKKPLTEFTELRIPLVSEDEKYRIVFIERELTEPGFILVPQDRITKAINYTLRNWEKLQRYLTDGMLPIDNGISERVIRDLAIGRNNWNAVGSDEGGKRMAILYSFNSTCKINGIDFEAYLADILMRLVIRSPNASVADLTPIAWLKSKNNGELPKIKPMYPSDS